VSKHYGIALSLIKRFLTFHYSYLFLIAQKHGYIVSGLMLLYLDNVYKEHVSHTIENEQKRFPKIQKGKNYL